MPHILANEYQQQCPIWGTPAKISSLGDYKQKIVSPRTGSSYLIDKRILLNGKFEYINDEKHKAKLTTMIIIKDNESDLQYVDDNYIKKAKNQNTLTVAKRTNRLLKYLVRKSEENLIGYDVHINPDYLSQDIVHFSLYKHLTDTEYIQSVKTCYEALAWSESIALQELHFLIEQLEAARLLKIIKRYGRGLSCRVTHEGYLKIEKDIINKDSSQAFIAMWFGNEKESEKDMNDLYDYGIDIAVKNTGYKALRIDRKRNVNKIDDEIIAEIRRSRFLIADYTHGKDGVRGGVYYEAGFAEGLGIPVLRSCRSGQFGDLHFDTRQYYHIKWETPEELRKGLEDRIHALIGEGPNIVKAN